jgi:hydroxyethylthiazole kinase-like uncharacterized protein yjeF
MKCFLNNTREMKRMKLVTPKQMNIIDTCTIAEYGIPGLLLMENAALAVVSEAVSMLGGSKDRRVLILAGRGNNGGDAFAVARLLNCRDADVRVYLVGPETEVTGDALTNLEILKKMGIEVRELIDKKELESLYIDIENAQLIIDGIFGTGLSRVVTDPVRAVIEMTNASGKPVLSIDIPSGIDGKDGSIKGICIKATETVTFCLPKMGLVLQPGCEYVGQLVIANIGIPTSVINDQKINTMLIDAHMVSPMIPGRMENSNKGDFGRILLVTGSTGMTGSGCLSSMAALRSGAGLVYAGVPKSLAHIYGSMLAEPVVLPLEDDINGCLTAESADQILEYMNRMTIAAIGPGLTASKSITSIVEEIISRSTIPIILDADALNAISGNTAILKRLSVKAVVTPHPGEMARLTGLSIRDVQADRIGIAGSFARSYGVTVVLKGSRTVIAQPDGRIFVNPTGNSGMATAGSGDVLTGIIAGIASQGAAVEDAAIAGVFLHGLAGDAAAATVGMYCMIADDIIRYLPQAFKDIMQYQKQN